MGIEQFMSSRQEVLVIDGKYRLVRTTYTGADKSIRAVVGIQYGNFDVCAADEIEVCIAEAVSSSFVVPRALVVRMLSETEPRKDS